MDTTRDSGLEITHEALHVIAYIVKTTVKSQIFIVMIIDTFSVSNYCMSINW